MTADIRLSNLWDRQIENDLPDCRLKNGDRDKSLVFLGRTPMALVYCADCGKPSGAATMFTPHVFFVCDSCVGRSGPPPGCREIDVPSHIQHVSVKDVIGKDISPLWALGNYVQVG